MKILVTGYTTRMWNSPRVEKDYASFPHILVDILREMGHEVEHKLIPLGTDILYKYNYAFCGVAPLGSMTANKLAETHQVMEIMRGHHCVFFDDWSCSGYRSSIKSNLGRWDRYSKYKGFVYTPDIVDTLQEHLMQMITIDNPNNNAPLIAPMFPWGDRSYLLRDNYKANLTTIDPSAWIKFPTVTITPFAERKLQWVMAALGDHMPWIRKQNFKFPIEYVGNKRLGDCEIISEDAVVRLFAKNFGALSAGHPSAGSGWWRPRYLHAAWAETLMYSDPRDAMVMGEAYKGQSYNFEALALRPEYAQTIVGQREWLESHIASKTETMAILDRIMRQ